MLTSLRYRLMDAREDGHRVAIGVAFEDAEDRASEEVMLYYGNEFAPPVRVKMEDLQVQDIRLHWDPEDLRLSEVYEATVEFDHLMDELDSLMDKHEARIRAA